MPSPNATLRWLLFSPVPSQTTFESFGSTLTAPRENDPPSSKIGVNMFPRLSVLNNPPDALATYQTLGFFGSRSMSEMRPVVMSGPIARSGIPLIVSDVSPDCWAPSVAQAAATARLRASVRFMAVHSRTSVVVRVELRRRCVLAQRPQRSGGRRADKLTPAAAGPPASRRTVVTDGSSLRTVAEEARSVGHDRPLAARSAARLASAIRRGHVLLNGGVPSGNLLTRLTTPSRKRAAPKLRIRPRGYPETFR